jgi:FkbM family methyltransferase
MIPRKVSIHAAFFCYAGNGGYSAILPDIAFWWAKIRTQSKDDPRIEKWSYAAYSDTPVTMTRNKAITMAKLQKSDYLLLIDSDNSPDCEPDGKPFWETSFDFLYQHYEKGPAIIFAPYGGPPPHEIPYVFKWSNFENDDTPERMRLEVMSREEASLYSGISDVAAAPTGLMLIDMRIFDLIDKPYFKYEFNEDESQKQSTEDVYFTRNASLNGIIKLGYNPLYCNFDAWAGHAKQKMVRKPRPLSANNVAETLQKAVQRGGEKGERLIVVGENANRDENGVKAKKQLRSAREAILTEADRQAILNADLGPMIQLDDTQNKYVQHFSGQQVHLRPDTQDSLVLKEIVENCYKLPEKFPDGAVVLDIGAHIGLFALECVKRGASKVICYEPERENYALLRANTQDEPKIECHNAAVWRSDKYESVELHGYKPVNGRNGDIYTAQHFVIPTENGHAIIKSVGLDEIIPTGGVYLLKLDCEGAELPILLTSKRFIVCENIVCELHAKRRDTWDGDLQEWLTRCSFTCSQAIRNKDNNALLFATRNKPSKLRQLIQELAYELGFKPNVIVIEPSSGTVAVEMADAGAMVYSVRPELTQEFQDAARDRLGDSIDLLLGEQWKSGESFHAPAHAVVFAGSYEGFESWRDKASHLLCGDSFMTSAWVERSVKQLPGEFESDGDFWFKKIEQTTAV